MIARYFILMAMLLVALLPKQAFAIANPDLLQIVSIRAYNNILEATDMLFMVFYRIDYTSPPTERASEAFLARFMDGAIELQSTTPYAFVNDGYSSGIVSFYFDAEAVIAGSLVWEDPYTVRLQGSPSFFATPPIVNSGSIEWTSPLVTKTRFKEHVIDVARDLEVVWAAYTTPDIIMVQSTPDGILLTLVAEDYFVNSIPDIRIIAPELFSSRTVSPDFVEREFDTTYADDLRTFWDGTSFAENFDTWAALLNMNRMLLTTFILLGFNLLIAYIAFVMTKSPAFTPLTVALIFPIGAYLGMTDMILAALMAAASAVAVSYILFLRRA